MRRILGDAGAIHMSHYYHSRLPGGNFKMSADRRRVVTGSGIEYAPVIRVAKLSAIGESVEGLRVLCHDLPDEARVDGLLGLSFFRRFDTQISFSHGVLELHRIA